MMQADIWAIIVDNSALPELIALHHTNQFLRAITEKKVNAFFQLKLKSEFPASYTFLNELNALNKNCFLRYATIRTIRLSPKRAERDEKKTESYLYFNLELLLAFISYAGFKWLGKRSQANWISKYMKDHPGISQEQALSEWNEYMKTLQTLST